MLTGSAPRCENVPLREEKQQNSQRLPGRNVTAWHAGQGKNCFYFDIKVVDGSDTKDEKSQPVAKPAALAA